MNQKQPEAADSSRSELAVGVVGGLVTLALIGFLLYQALVLRDRDPQLSAAVVAVEAAAPGFVAQLRVRNTGGGTAEAVHVTGSVTRAGSTVEEVTATIAYVPPSSSREATLVFAAPPGRGDLQVRVTGYVPS